MAAWLSFVSFLFYLHLRIIALQAEDIDLFTKFSPLNLPPGVVSPDSAFIDRHNKGPYVGVADGRILKYNGADFEEFAHISPDRTKEECDGVGGGREADMETRRKCGRPWGFAYHSKTENLYMMNAFGGLYVVGPEGGLATLLATEANDQVPFHFPSGMDVDVDRDLIYFTDESLEYKFEDILEGRPHPIGDSTGRLMEYNIKTEEVRVLDDGLSRPAGPAVSSDGSYLLYSSASTKQVLKYSISTKITNILQLNIPGSPWKIKRAPNLLPLVLPDAFWVAVNVQQDDGSFIPYGYKFDSFGEVHLKKDFSKEFPNSQVVVVQGYDLDVLGGKLYVGVRDHTYLGEYSTI